MAYNNIQNHISKLIDLSGSDNPYLYEEWCNSIIDSYNDQYLSIMNQVEFCEVKMTSILQKPFSLFFFRRTDKQQTNWQKHWLDKKVYHVIEDFLFLYNRDMNNRSIQWMRGDGYDSPMIYISGDQDVFNNTDNNFQWLDKGSRIHDEKNRFLRLIIHAQNIGLPYIKEYLTPLYPHVKFISNGEIMGTNILFIDPDLISEYRTIGNQLKDLSNFSRREINLKKIL